ncbi:Holo-[acyl-carrier protein] synthase, belongs to 4-phosphopantetheinyl transferase superfamily [Bifidobacterium breve 2L]|nr:Holo-[acyl-carrier protein] synthase, belongs to 4-phosphopantetheinyl transferase superfamily [Bifidobacterium breve 2L]
MELELNFDGTWNLRAKRWTMGTMNTFGLGHDVVDVAAFAEQLGQPGSHMRALFSVREVRQAADRARQKNDGEAVHLAAKWAGKEAFLKAWCDFLGGAPFPFTLDNFPWREIEILDDSRGVPHVSLSGDASPAFQTDYLGLIPDVRISLSHDGPVASAVVMIQSGNNSREIR